MYRFLLSGRWIALMIVGLTLVAAFTMLGFWQLGKFRAPADTGPSSVESRVATATEADPGPRELVRRPPGEAQNLAYALQWWVFAGATVFFGIRALRIEAQDRVTAAVRPPEGSDAAHP